MGGCVADVASPERVVVAEVDAMLLLPCRDAIRASIEDSAAAMEDFDDSRLSKVAAGLSSFWVAQKLSH